MTFVTLVIFLVSYLLMSVKQISWLPLGRTGGALLGAVAMVVAGALTPEQAYDAIDHDTLALLLGMMLITAHLEQIGLLRQLSQALMQRARSPLGLLGLVVAIAGIGSAFFVNDTICLFLTPSVVHLCRNAKLPFGPYLLALATSANIGSAATLVGNPQNMIIGGLSDIPFGRFAAIAAPAAGIGLAANFLLLWLYYRHQLPKDLPNTPAVSFIPDRSTWWAAGTGIGVIGCFFAGFHLGFSALAGALLLMITERRDPAALFSKVDWSLLLFFSALFVVVAGVGRTGVVDVLWIQFKPLLTTDTWSGTAAFSGATVIGSNVVSNVPLVLLAAPYVAPQGEAAWILLAYVATLAGNLTLIGSVANLIVAEGAKSDYELGFFEYIKFGAVSTAVTIALGVPVIRWLAYS